MALRRDSRSDDEVLSFRCARSRSRSAALGVGSCVALAWGLVLSGCSGEGGANGNGSPSSGGSGGGARPIIVDPNASTGATGATGGPTTDPGECGETALNGCAGIAFEGESVPLDIYIMFDQSGSMLNDVGGMTRLEAVRRATTEFLRDDATRGIGVGIGYFGHQAIGETSCENEVYENADVGVSLDHESVIRSLASRAPTGETPTAAALNGACRYASQWEADNPGRSVVILLVTDGKPEAPVSCGNGGCCPDIEQAESAASACFDGSRHVPTYVLGVGPNLDLLNRIAKAGGTRQAYLVGDDNVQENVLRALNGIRGDAIIPCQLELPEPAPGQTLDYGAVNLFISQNSCDFEPVYHVEHRDQCGDEVGWYYDDNGDPHTVELCPTSCDLVSRPSSRLRFSVGCATIAPPVR